MAQAGQNTPLPGYVAQVGDKLYMKADHNGPSSYSNIGSSSGTGDVINALDFGAGGFESIGVTFSAYSFSGNYIVKVIPKSGTAVTPLGTTVPTYALQWFTVSGGAFGTISTEVTNGTSLAAETVRLDLVMV